jgi:hypothetical protein
VYSSIHNKRKGTKQVVFLCSIYHPHQFSKGLAELQIFGGNQAEEVNEQVVLCHFFTRFIIGNIL